MAAALCHTCEASQLKEKDIHGKEAAHVKGHRNQRRPPLPPYTARPMTAVAAVAAAALCNTCGASQFKEEDINGHETTHVEGHRKLKHCGGCHSASYCSKGCQRFEAQNPKPQTLNP